MTLYKKQIDPYPHVFQSNFIPWGLWWGDVTAGCFSQNAQTVKEMFPVHPRFSRLLFTALDDGGGGKNTDAPNVLTKTIFDEIWGVVNEVRFMNNRCYPPPDL